MKRNPKCHPWASLLLMLLAGLALRLAAAEIRPEPDPVSYRATRYTAEQGLPQNTIRALLQTCDGYLWVGTLAGLARFDGVKFRVFDMSNTPEMSHDAINALAEDRQDGSLWINTGNELLRYHQHQFERFHIGQGIPHPFGDLWPARQGGLWYSPSYGRLIRLQNRAVSSWQLEDQPVLGHQIMQVEEDEQGSLLVLMHKGLFRFLPATGTLTPLGPPAATDTSYRGFYPQTDGTLLVAAREGLWRRTGTQWERIQSVSANDQAYPVRICPATNGDLWIPWSDDGPPRLARFRQGRSEFIDLSEIPDFPMNRFLQDREEHLWVGTESGLCQLRPKLVRVFAREHGLRNDYVKSLSQGPDGTIWLGTAAGLSGIKDGQVTNLPPVEPPSNWGRAEGLLADRLGRVWYGVRAHTVAAFEQGKWLPPAPLVLEQSWIRTLYEDRSGRIWAGFAEGVAWLNEMGAVQKLPRALSHPDVRVIHQDRRGDLWFGTYGGGLNRLHEGQITVYTTALGEYNNRAWCIHEDADGVFWVGSRGGLNRFVPPGVKLVVPALAGQAIAWRGPSSTREVQPAKAGTTNADRFFTFTTRHGLHENTINNVQEDDFGYLWLSGLQGIYRVSRGELNEIALGRQAQAQVLAFGEVDGLLNSQCNGGINQPSGCKDRAGRIWFPTARGVAMIDPRNIHSNEVPPPVVIEQVLADNQVVLGDGRPNRPGDASRDTRLSPTKSEANVLRLAPGRTRVLEIHYTGNSFAAPQRMRFKYRLEGYDQDWRYDDQNRRVAFYTSLWPGAYTFHVLACNNHGVWSETAARFSFILAPHFWQTWLFYVLAGAGIIGLAAALQAYRLRWQHRLLKLEHQQALADERTRIARDLHDDLGTALTGLALELDVARRDAGTATTLTRRLADAAGHTRELAERMREVVWAVNPRCDNVPSVASVLEQLASQFLDAAEIRVRLEFPEDIPSLPLDSAVRHQLVLGVREALTNVVRHAAASEVRLCLAIEGQELLVRVRDNGSGFTPNGVVKPHHGLGNLCARMEHIGGSCEWASAPGSGTTVTFRVPLAAGASNDRTPQ